MTRASFTSNAVMSRRNASSSFLIVTLMVLAALAAGAFPALASHTSDEGPEITELDPESGPPETYVVVVGDGFTASDTVFFGGTVVSHDYYSSSRVGFYVPELAENTYEIEVEGESSSDSFCCFEITDGEANGTSNGTSSNDTEPDDEPSGQPTAGDQTLNDPSCRESGMNVQCNEFGTIKMESQREIRGEPIDIDVELELDTNYADQDARQMLISIRNVTQFDDSPIVIELEGITAGGEEVYTSRIDEKGPNELNIWIDVLDVPVDTPITISVNVGATDRGAFQLESLVMPFDRGYEPIKDSSGMDISLYSYTLLGVHDETGALDSGNPISKLTPAPSVALLIATVGLLALVGGRRKQA